MPIKSFNMPDTLQTVDKQMVLSVIDDLVNYDLFPDEPDIQYAEAVKKIRRKGDNENGRGLDKSMLGDNVLYVQVQRKNLEEVIHGKRSKRLTRPNILHDKAIGFNVSAVYSNIEYRMSTVYSTSSLNKLILLRQGIKDRALEGNMNIMHDINFTFAFPDELAELVKTIYDLKETTAPFNIKLNEYVYDIADSGVITQTTDEGNHPRLVVDEEQVDILGMMMGDYELEIIDNENGTYSIEIEYVFVASRPYAFHVRYLPMVHNSLLPVKYLDVTPIARKGSRSSIEPMTRLGMDKQKRAFESSNLKFPIRTPVLNDEIMPYSMVGYMPLIQALCSVEDDKRTLLKLNELGNVHLDERIIDFLLQGEYQHITSVHDSLFQVRLLRNTKITHRDQLEILPDLTVKHLTDLNFRDYHHVVIFMNTELEHVSDDAIRRAIAHPGILDIVLNTLNELSPEYRDLRDGILGVYLNGYAPENRITALDNVRDIRTFLIRILGVSTARRTTLPLNNAGLDFTVIKMDEEAIGNLRGDFSVMQSSVTTRRI